MNLCPEPQLVKYFLFILYYYELVVHLLEIVCLSVLYSFFISLPSICPCYRCLAPFVGPCSSYYFHAQHFILSFLSPLACFVMIASVLLFFFSNYISLFAHLLMFFMASSPTLRPVASGISDLPIRLLFCYSVEQFIAQGARHDVQRLVSRPSYPAAVCYQQSTYLRYYSKDLV